MSPRPAKTSFGRPFGKNERDQRAQKRHRQGKPTAEMLVRAEAEWSKAEQERLRREFLERDAKKAA